MQKLVELFQFCILIYSIPFRTHFKRNMAYFHTLVKNPLFSACMDLAIKNFSNCKKRRSRDSFSVKSQQNRKKRRSRVSFSVKSQLEKSVKWQLSLLFSNSILNIATGSTMLKMWSS